MRKLIAIFFVVFLSFASFYSISTDFEYTVFNSDSSKISTPEELKNLDEEDFRIKMAKDFFALKKKNKDLVAWINVPNVCYYPVMYTGDQYYLRKDVDGSYKYSGTLFMSKESNGRFNDTAVIYGHHMNDGSMFGSLKQYEYEKFFSSNPETTVFDGEYFYTYKQYTTVYIVDGKESIKHKWPNLDVRENYFKSLYKKNEIKNYRDKNIDFKQPMLFLQTCEYFFEDCRLVVGLYQTEKEKY